MSCDWNIRCLDCNEDERFDDANHRVEAMRTFIKYAKVIGTLVPLMNEENDLELKFGHHYGRLDPTFFAKHADHRLIPVNEYGSYDDECGEQYTCSECESSKTCHLLKDHENKHSEIRK